MEKSQHSKIPSWQASEAKPNRERLLWLKALRDGNEKAIQVELIKCRDPWYWLTNWAMTENPASQKPDPFEKFPDKQHLYNLTRIFEREKRLIIPKSRQMTVTWLFIALYLHEAMWKPSRLIFIQSKKEQDADEVLERGFSIYQKLPTFMRNWQPLTHNKKTFCEMKFSRNRSRILAVPEGPDHIRGFSPTDIFSDETCFQDDVEKMTASAMPALGLHGRLVMVSSAAPSFMELLAMDRANARAS